MRDVIVIIPTYNEIENIAHVVARVIESTDRADVLIVDDNSPDGTGVLADSLAVGEPRVHVLHRTQKSGLGDAYRAGFAWGLRSGYSFLVEMDGDGSHRPEHLRELLAAAESADLVLGSRWIKGGGAPGWPLRRVLLSRGGSLYARLALGLSVGDATGGYRVFRASALELIRYQTVVSQGYCFQIEMLWRATLEHLRVVERPIVFEERTAGTSKMTLGIVGEAILRVTIWGVSGFPSRIARLVPFRHRGDRMSRAPGSIG